MSVTLISNEGQPLYMSNGAAQQCFYIQRMLEHGFAVTPDEEDEVLLLENNGIPVPMVRHCLNSLSPCNLSLAVLWCGHYYASGPDGTAA